MSDSAAVRLSHFSLAEARRQIKEREMSDKCETCKGYGFYGDMGPGIAGNTEWQECECLEADDPQRLKAALKTALATLDSTITNRDHTQARYDALRITSETTIGQLRQQIVHLKDRVTELEAGIVSFLDCAMRDEATLLKEGDKAGWWDTNALTPLCEIGDTLVDFGKWEIHPDGYGSQQFYRPIEVDARKEPT